MKKSGKAPLIISYILVGVVLVGVIGLLIGQAALNNWVFDKDNVTKGVIVIAGLIITLIKLISKSGGSVPLRRYDALYRNEIGSAFSTPDRKKQKNALLKAVADYNENRLDAAIKRLHALHSECSTADDYSAVLMFLALTYSEAGMIDDAVSAYEELLKKSPAYSTAWSNLGLLYKKQGKIDRAIPCFETAIKHDENNAYAWNNLAQAYLAENKWEKVIAPAKRSVSLKSDMVQAENALTIAYFAMNDMEKSKEHFDRAVTLGSDASMLTSLMNGMAEGTVAFGVKGDIREEVTAAMGHLQRDTALPMVEVRLPAPHDGNLSRFGGAPVDSAVPTDSKGQPMKLLAAIWCKEVRGVPDFPTKGVLRFYVSDNNVYGADFKNPAKQSDFRVLYDENEEGFRTELCDDTSVSESFPIRHVLPLRLSPAMGSIRSTDYRFEECVNSALVKAGVDGGMKELSEAEQDFIYAQNVYAGHRIGGHPSFEQYDPREKSELRKYDTLLLQIVSHISSDEKGEEHELIMFGDEGGCQFFIPVDKLRARDFSDVMFWWDCA